MSTARETRVDDRSIGREEHSGLDGLVCTRWSKKGKKGRLSRHTLHPRVIDAYLVTGIPRMIPPLPPLSLSPARTEFVRRRDRRRRRSIFGRARPMPPAIWLRLRARDINRSLNAGSCRFSLVCRFASIRFSRDNIRGLARSAPNSTMSRDSLALAHRKHTTCVRCRRNVNESLT